MPLVGEAFRWRADGLVVGLSCVVAILLAACGGSPGSAPQPHVHGVELAVTSPLLSTEKPPFTIPSETECSEHSIWVPLEWSEPPPGTQEIVVVISVDGLSYESGSVESSLLTEWVIGGLLPGSRRLEAGELPLGAFITGHERRQPNCPSRSVESVILFSVYAMPPGRRLFAFEAIGFPTVQNIAKASIGHGTLTATYGRRDG